MINKDKSSPWVHFDISHWKELLWNQNPRLYRKNSFLFQQGDPPEHIFIIKSGRVRITTYNNEGNEKQLYIAETGAICGELACIQNQPHFVSAIAIVDSQVFCLPYRVVESQMQNNRSLAGKLMQMVCQKSLIFIEQILELSFYQSTQRVARILLNIAAQYGQAMADGSTYITIKFTHQDIASMINTSRVTISNIFNELSSKGIIVRERGHYILKDIATLQEYFDDDSFSSVEASLDIKADYQ